MTRLLVLVVSGVFALAAAQVQPLSLILLIDVTASVSDAMATVEVADAAPPRSDGTGSREDMPLPEIRKKPNSPRDLFLGPIVKGFIPHLAPRDRVRIGRIAQTVRLDAAFTGERAALTQATREALDVPAGDRYGPTPLWDAIDAAVTALEDESGRRVIVLVTDGLSTGNRKSLDDVIEHARRSRVAVSIVGEWWGWPRVFQVRPNHGFSVSDDTGSTWKTMVWPFGNRPDVNLRRLAGSTGGVFLGDGLPDCASAWAKAAPCGDVAQTTADDCGSMHQSSNRWAQCAGTDPTVEAALTAILEHLHRP